MKKLVIGMLFLGLASLGFSQSSNAGLEEVKLSDVTITPLNLDYIDKVREDDVSEKVFTMEKKASRYNIKESPFFNNHAGLFKIKFSKKNGRIIAVYDREGKIRSTMERYKDLMLPPAVRNSVYRAHPDWTMVGNAYLVSYHYNNGVKKVYKVKIAKGDLQKKLKMDTQGNLL